MSQVPLARSKMSGIHPSTTATVPVSSGGLALAAEVSQRHVYEMISADIKSVNGTAT